MPGAQGLTPGIQGNLRPWVCRVQLARQTGLGQISLGALPLSENLISLPPVFFVAVSLHDTD